MLNLEIRTISTLELSDESRGFLDPIRLSAHDFRVMRTPDDCDYKKMIEMSCDSASNTMDCLLRRGYKAWLVIVGSGLTDDVQRRFPALRQIGAIARQARDEELVGDTLLEGMFETEGIDRAIGIYGIHSDLIRRAINFCFFHSYSLLVFSCRDEFQTQLNLALLYQSITAGTDPRGIIASNWEVLALAICRKGDVVIKTWGGFDDLCRAIQFTFSPDIRSHGLSECRPAG